MRSLLVLFSFSFLFVSCSNDEADGMGTLKVSARAAVNQTSGSAKEAGSARSVNTDVFVSTFLVNITEFELEMDDWELEIETESEIDDDSWDDDGYYDFEDEFELEGPFELDLLAGEISFLAVDVPNGEFEELEFKFDRSTNPESNLFGKSVLIEGTVNDVLFIFWHDFEDEVEVDFEEPEFDITINNNTEGISIEFDLSLIFDVVAGIDLSQAVDGNEDGTIEISPEDPDGNNELAHMIRERIKTAIDLLDD
ncbi:hypothetical protein [Lentiprolixibacter aurantiacus]|uniref:Lipoprotein n=1 Tax=Lentiprolixibacter aurantiacus TaxID=2993939 RepID=A0AAE3MLV0_9FLAO|nr:hypothetical protein [Lentiprolixibacter aurantiacus]MCX2719823.1 hypothetical protein [Lentiprolixibacter aurantiacus]